MARRNDDSFELRCNDVKEVMGPIPSIINRLGMALTALIMLSLIAVIVFVKIPIIEEYPFMLTWADGENTPCITVHVPASSVKYVLDTDRNVTLTSDAFPKELNNMLPANVGEVSGVPNSDGSYNVDVKIAKGSEGMLPRVAVTGKARLVVSENTIVNVKFKL